MIATFLIENTWLTTAGLLAVLVAGPFVAYRVRPRAAWWLTGASALAVLVITLYPEKARPLPGCFVSWSVPTLGAVELIANILLFVPVVLFAAVASNRVVVPVLAGSVFSVAIETAQAALPVLGRACDTGDWLQNTIGALLGGLLAAVGLALRRRRLVTNGDPA